MKTIMLAAIALVLAFASFARADELKIEKPKKDPFAIAPKPAVVNGGIHFDTGWWARAHWTAAAFDYSTTGFANGQCREYFTVCGETDPIAKPFIGGPVNPPWRLTLGWIGESALVSIIPNKKIRRATQIALIASHVFCGARNLKNWH